uniref:Uncharacterized protein n=1 Tax=Arundo donax TaxID=35708 RepID=A0A0A9FPN6_ARUDO
MKKKHGSPASPGSLKFQNRVALQLQETTNKSIHRSFGDAKLSLTWSRLCLVFLQWGPN